MEINESQKSFLHTVHQFSRSPRYHGMMPKKLAQGCDESDLREAFANGYIALGSVKPHMGQEIEGLMLTEKGLRLLEQS